MRVEVLPQGFYLKVDGMEGSEGGVGHVTVKKVTMMWKSVSKRF